MTTAKNEKTEVGELSGTAYYTFVHKPRKRDETFGNPPMYQISLIPDEKSKKIIEGYGHKLTPAKGNIPGDYFDIKNKIYGEDGSEEFKKSLVEKKPDVVDAKLNTVPEDVLIGNGSKVKVKVGWKYVKVQRKRFPRFYGLQVLSLVPYEGKDSSFKAEKDGYVVGSEGDPNDDI